MAQNVTVPKNVTVIPATISRSGRVQQKAECTGRAI